MIARLIDTLRALAAPADVQLARHPDLTAGADAVAADFGDALRLASDCPQLGLDDEQRDALDAVEELLERMSGAEGATPWTEEALRSAPEWEEVRTRARAALLRLEHDAEGGVG